MNGINPRTASDRGNPAGFDAVTGEVFGSGAGAGGNEDSNEDYDRGQQGQIASCTEPRPGAQ